MNTPDEIKPLETRLKTLLPTVGGLNHDRLMFEAGKAAARRAARPWQAASWLLAVALASTLALRPATTDPDRVAETPSGATGASPASAYVRSTTHPGETLADIPPVAPEPVPPPLFSMRTRVLPFIPVPTAESSYADWRDFILTSGVDALKSLPSGPPVTSHRRPTPPLNRRELEKYLENLL